MKKQGLRLVVKCLALSTALVVGMTSCEVEPTIEQVQNQVVTYPNLDTFTPEEDVVSQARSQKRGVCTNFRIPAMPDFLGEGVSWCYNWAHTPFGQDRWEMLRRNDMEFIPMIWNAGFSDANLGTIMQEGGSKWLLAYNEPNLTDQANMTPSQAAENWPNVVAVAKKYGYKIVGPAVNYGTLSGYSDPVVWYKEFLAHPNVDINDIEAIALHCYMPNGNAVKSLMIRKFVNFFNEYPQYRKPLWLTEFESGDAQTEAAQMLFCAETITYLEADPNVERYAWFMDNTGSNDRAPHFPLVTVPVMGVDSHITELGKLYVGLSSYDKNNYYDVDVNIPAEHYSGQIIEESADADGWGAMVKTRKTSDVYGNFEIYDMKNGNWVEYGIDVPHTSKYRLDLRYSAEAESVVMIDCEGTTSVIAMLPPTTALMPYTTMGIEIILPAGKQTIRVNGAQGNFALNWLRVTSPLATETTTIQ